MERPRRTEENEVGLPDRLEARLDCEKSTQKTWTDAEVRQQQLELQALRQQLEAQSAELAELRKTRKEAEESLSRYVDLYHSAPLGYFTLSRDSKVLDANITGARLLGLEPNELLGRHLRTLITPKFRAPFETFQNKSFASRAPEFCELEFVKANKQRFFAHVEAQVDESGERCFAIVKDVTARRIVSEGLRIAHRELETRVRERTTELVRANEELEETKRTLRQLAIHQDGIKEAERKRIAREIHDDLGQNLLALRIDVSLLHARTGGGSHPKLHERVGEALRQIDLAMTSVRAVINDLRPNVLDLGLPAAVEWQAKEFGRRTGIRCVVRMREQDFAAGLDGNLALAFFRILQESLSNITRHAHATSVMIELNNDGVTVQMRVTDDGVGIAPDAEKKENSFGLVGIKERVVTLAGEVHIDGGEGAGTTLTVCVPLNPPPMHLRPGFVERRRMH